MARKKVKKLEDMRKLSDADLDKEIEEAYRRLFSLRLQKATLQLTNHRELPAAKRRIAQLKTLKRERELARVVRGAGE
jgi:large subunit ribosomal protein L29